MFDKFPKLMIAFLAFQALIIGSLSYSVYQKHAVLAACRANLERVQATEAQFAATEAQLDRQESELTAAEARLNGGQ
jgi:hypothetical protein